MHPESKVFIGGQQGQMRESTGEHAGFVHQGSEAEKIYDDADVVGHSIYDGRKNKEGFDLRTRDESISFHVSTKRWPHDMRYSTKGYEKVAEAAEKRTKKAPVTVVIY